jgi:hypothetical protein
VSGVERYIVGAGLAKILPELAVGTELVPATDYDSLSRRVAELEGAIEAAAAAMPPVYAYGDNEAACWMAGKLVALRKLAALKGQG